MNKLFFLLIDDDSLANALTAKLIEKVFIHVDIHKVNKHQSSIELLEENIIPFPDLIFLDINLGNENGWDLLEGINNAYARKKIKELPKVIVLTSSIFEGDKIRSSQYENIIKFISKPMSVVELQEIADDFFN